MCFYGLWLKSRRFNCFLRFLKKKSEIMYTWRFRKDLEFSPKTMCSCINISWVYVNGVIVAVWVWSGCSNKQSHVLITSHSHRAFTLFREVGYTKIPHVVLFRLHFCSLCNVSIVICSVQLVWLVTRGSSTPIEPQGTLHPKMYSPSSCPSKPVWLLSSAKHRRRYFEECW